MSLGPLTKIEAKPEPKTLAMLEELLGTNPGEGTPKLFGYWDRSKKLRRMVASYPNGWTVRVNVNATGIVTSTSFKISLKAKARSTHAEG